MSRTTVWILVLLVAALLLTGVAVWQMHRHADAVLAREAKEIEDAFALLLTQDARRPPLDAWPADRPATERTSDARRVYADAWDAVAAIPEAELEQVPENRHVDLEEIDEAEVAAFFARHQAIFDRLQDARYADRISFDPAVDYGLGTAVVERIDRIRALNSLQSGRIRHALATGDAGAALSAMRQQLLLGSDLRRMGGLIHHLVGGGTMRLALQQLRVLLAQDRLTEPDLAALARDLDQAAYSRVSLETLWSREDLTTRRFIVHAAAAYDWSVVGADLGAGWKHLFSPRLVAAETLESLPELIGLFRGLDAMTWPDAIQHVQRAADEEAKDPATIHRKMILVTWPRVAWQTAVVAAELEVARLAVAVARYRRAQGAWPEALDDLVPTYRDALVDCPLALQPHGYEAGKIWSWGGDGDDDGGRPIEDADWSTDGDSVWDLNDKTIPDPFEHLR